MILAEEKSELLSEKNREPQKNKQRVEAELWFH